MKATQQWESPLASVQTGEWNYCSHSMKSVMKSLWNPGYQQHCDRTVCCVLLLFLNHKKHGLFDSLSLAKFLLLAFKTRNRNISWKWSKTWAHEANANSKVELVFTHWGLSLKVWRGCWFSFNIWFKLVSTKLDSWLVNN